MSEKAWEVNFDSIVGPTHNYAGLSYGNVASQKFAGTISNPRAAALEGLQKMQLLMQLGLKQAVLPPHPRPQVDALRRWGFAREGSDRAILARAAQEEPALLAAACSASAMWAANAATVSPAADCVDGRLHLTVANLCSQVHRSIEWPTTLVILRCIFNDESLFAVHEPLPASLHFADEGAANHTRLCGSWNDPGVELFVFGRRSLRPHDAQPARFPARQTFEASAAIARSHQLQSHAAVFAQQNPAAIDAGVFHNDVIAVGNQDVLFYHQQAWHDPAGTIAQLREAFRRTCDRPLQLIEVTSAELSVPEAVATYLFNSQLVTLPGDDAMALIAPVECREHAGARAVIDRMRAQHRCIRDVHFVDIRQSMQNGGGPACLRLRVVLTQRQIERMHQGVLLTEPLLKQLTDWVQRHYRAQLTLADLADPKLIDESHAALDELTQLLGLGAIYDFQQASHSQ